MNCQLKSFCKYLLVKCYNSHTQRILVGAQHLDVDIDIKAGGETSGIVEYDYLDYAESDYAEVSVSEDYIDVDVKVVAKSEYSEFVEAIPPRPIVFEVENSLPSIICYYSSVPICPCL